MPPALLISSITIWAVFLSGSPRKEAGPVTAKRAPILIGGAAKAMPDMDRVRTAVSTMDINLERIIPPDNEKLVCDDPIAFADLNHFKSGKIETVMVSCGERENPGYAKHFLVLFNPGPDLLGCRSRLPDRLDYQTEAVVGIAPECGSFSSIGLFVGIIIVL